MELSSPSKHGGKFYPLIDFDAVKVASAKSPVYSPEVYRKDEYKPVPKNPRSVLGNEAYVLSGRGLENQKVGFGTYFRYISRSRADHQYYHDTFLVGSYSQDYMTPHVYLEKLRASYSTPILESFKSGYSDAIKFYEDKLREVGYFGESNTSIEDIKNKKNLNYLLIQYTRYTQKHSLVKQELTTRKRVETMRLNRKLKRENKH